MFQLRPPSFTTELRHRFLRLYCFDTLPGQIVASVGTSAGVTPPVLRLSTGAGGANRVVSRGENSGFSIGYDPFVGRDGLSQFGRPWRVVCSVLAGESLTNATPTTYAGISINTFTTAPPWAAVHFEPMIQLRARLDTNVWQLVVQRGDAVTAETVTQLTGVAAPIGGEFVRLEIAYKPGEYVRAFVDGLLGAEQTANLPDTTITPCMAGAVCFVTSGTDAAGQNQSLFANLQAETWGMP